MRNWIVCFLLALTPVGPGAAQQAGPQVKSEEEQQALAALQTAQDPQSRAAAAKLLLKNFPDSDFKEAANYVAMLSYQQMNDYESMLLYGEQTLAVNPDNVGVLVSLAYAIPIRTREFDLDKDEKLAKAEDFAKRALVVIPNMPKMDPNLTDEQWLMTKKDFMAQVNEALGMVALKREEHEKAEQFLKKAITLATQPSPMAHFSLAQSQKEQGKIDAALESINKCLADGGVPGTDFAEKLKAAIEQAQ